MGKRVPYKEISAEKVKRGPMTGAWRCSAMIDGYRVEQTYLYYTKRQALRLFHASVNV